MFKKRILSNKWYTMVKFDNGKWGIKSLSSGWYVDLKTITPGRFHWEKGDQFYPHCQGNYWLAKWEFNKIAKRMLARNVSELPQ
ncbi:MAG: hypothetical protein ACXW1D_00050 [Halobacteriota archaeon]